MGIDYSEFAFHSVYNEKRPGIVPNSGTCVPGEKLYISVDGKIHTCEKINSDFYIGNVDSGLNYERIVNVVKEYNKVIGDRCSHCKASRFCSICFAQSCDDHKFSMPMKKCKDFETYIKNKMIKYVTILEQNPGLFDEVTLDYYNSLYRKVGACFEI